MEYIAKFIYILTVVVILMTVPSNGNEDGGPSDESEFLHQPDNMTIPEGDSAVMKCKMNKIVQRCRWYFLEEGLNFFDGRANPVMVKDFQPRNPQDCSIKLKRVRELQEGQWLCQALQIHKSHFIISKPGFLKVITEQEAREGRELAEKEIAKNIKAMFVTTEDDHIQTTNIEMEATLDCRINKPLTTCSWVMPHGNVLHYIPYEIHMNKSSEPEQKYSMKGRLSEGNCSLTITRTSLRDEGNWRCVVQVKGVKEETGETRTLMGPLIHLHLMDIIHEKVRSEALTPLQEEGLTLIVSLVSVSLVLFIIVLLLFCCLYRRINSSKEETKNILPTSSVSTNDYSHKWMKKLSLPNSEPEFGDTFKSKELPINYTDLNHYNQYLDMTGTCSTVDGYIIMPGSSSVKSSCSSGTTISTVSTMPMDRDRSLSSATTTSNLSSNNSSNGEDFSFDNQNYTDDHKHARPVSIYSASHLYEEIPENRCEVRFTTDLKTAPQPTYTNLTEDQEGYMIPNKVKNNTTANVTLMPKIAKLPEIPRQNERQQKIIQTNQKILNTKILTPSESEKAPPYCQVGQAANTKEMLAVNLEYELTKSPLVQNYDVPRGSKESLAQENIKISNFEESYDVPKQTAVKSSLNSNNTKVEVSLGSIAGTIV